MHYQQYCFDETSHRPQTQRKHEREMKMKGEENEKQAKRIKVGQWKNFQSEIGISHDYISQKLLVVCNIIILIGYVMYLGCMHACMHGSCS